MSPQSLAPQNWEIKQQQPVAVDRPVFVTRIRNSIWFVGIPSWLFGITDRSMAAFADGYLSPVELVHLFTASVFFLCWLFLKPEESEVEGTIPPYQPVMGTGFEAAFNAFRARMVALQQFHLIRQEYTLPYPYLCQIYHLLNLKHLEDIHSFSLNNLKIVQVGEFLPTAIGGKLKFETMLDSPYNPLRIWRQPIVEVDLVLHTPYTVELCIPIYNDRKIVVIFNVMPLNENEHRLFIDIYSDFQWFKPIMQIMLHVASCLTLFEDLSYLQALAERNLYRVVQLGRVSNHETMQLFKRFVDLYGAGLEPATERQLLPAARSPRPAHHS